MIDRQGRATKLRRSYNDPGDAHELTFSCYHGLPLLGKDRTRQWLVDGLNLAREKWGLELWAYVIMPDHVHVLLSPPERDYDISAILKTIKQSVSRRAMAFLRENAPDWLTRLEVRGPDGQVEHRFWQQGGGYDRNIESAAIAWASVEYIHNNPVRRGLAACPTDWVWSSARWYTGEDGVILPMDACPPQPPPGTT